MPKKRRALTVVSAGHVDQGPVIQRKDLKEGEDGPEYASEVFRVRLIKRRPEHNSKNKQEQEHEDDDGAHGPERLKAG